MLLSSEKQGIEKEIFRYQFLLNYLSTPNDKKYMFICEQLAFIENNFKSFIYDKILPLLNLKKTKKINKIQFKISSSLT